MSIAHAVRELQTYPEKTSREFREQLTIIDKIKTQQNQDRDAGYQAPETNQGMDRGQSLRPIARPSFIRTHSRAF